MNAKEFAAKLKSVRVEKKIKRKEVAEKLGVTLQTYTNYENAYRMPQILKLPIISAVLGVSIDYLLGISNE